MILNCSSQQGKQAFFPAYLSHKYCRFLLLLPAASFSQPAINILLLFVTQQAFHCNLAGFTAKEKSYVFFLSPYIHNHYEEGFYLLFLLLSFLFCFVLISHLLIICFSENAGAFTTSYKWCVLKEQYVACCPLM